MWVKTGSGNVAREIDLAHMTSHDSRHLSREKYITVSTWWHVAEFVNGEVGNRKLIFFL